MATSGGDNDVIGPAIGCMLAVRPGTIKDLAAIGQIHLACLANTELDLDTVIQRKAAIYFGTSRDIIHDLYVATLPETASRQEAIVGYISVVRNAPDLPGHGSEIDDLYVHPEYQQQGAGKELLARVREDNQCESWVRVSRNAVKVVEWFKSRGYTYHHTEIAQDGMLNVLRWPGVITRRLATVQDTKAIFSLFVSAVFENPGIAHGSSAPADFLDTITNRLFPKPSSDFAAYPLVYHTPAGGLAGVTNIHAPLSASPHSKQVELNVFLTDVSLGAKDLANNMMQHIIEEHESKASITVKTWTVNKRAITFYRRNGFIEQSREDELQVRQEENRPARITLVRPRAQALA